MDRIRTLAKFARPFAPFILGLAVGGAVAGYLYRRHLLQEEPHSSPGSGAPSLSSATVDSAGGNTAGAPAGNLCDHLYTAACHSPGESVDPTGAVRPDVEGELHAIRIYKEFQEKHPHWSREQLDDALVARIYTPKRRKRIQSAFLWVQYSLERFIDLQPESVFTEREKRQLKARVHHIRLELPPPAQLYADEPHLLTKNDVFYERLADGRTRMRVGGAYLYNSKSWFNIIFTMAHEIAHSIDPCEVRAARMSFPAYDRLSACFVKTSLVDPRRTREECGKDDQLSEVFADWVAVQITADALAQFAAEYHGVQLKHALVNSVRDLCEQDDVLADQEVHPAPRVRIEAIFGQSPKIREILGCGPPPPDSQAYCSF